MRRPLLILGATGPIGRGVVQAAVGAGRPVIAAGCDEPGLATLRTAYPDADLQLVHANFRDDAGAASLVQALHALRRPIEGVIATLCSDRERGRLLDQPASRLRDTIDDIVIPHLAAARHLLPMLASAGRSGGYVLIDGPGGAHPWAGYSHRSVAAAALRMLARALHDEARNLPVRVQMLSVELPVRTDANAAQACAHWPSAVSIGRRALAMIDRRDSDGAAPLVHCADACDEGGGLTLAQDQARSSVAPAQNPDSDGSLLTSRCLQDVRTLLDSLKTTVPMKGDSPR